MAHLTSASFPRKRESIFGTCVKATWIPAFAGMTPRNLGALMGASGVQGFTEQHAPTGCDQLFHQRLHLVVIQMPWPLFRRLSGH
jgi:hypothetical protein